MITQIEYVENLKKSFEEIEHPSTKKILDIEEKKFDLLMDKFFNYSRTILKSKLRHNQAKKISNHYTFSRFLNEPNDLQRFIINKKDFLYKKDEMISLLESIIDELKLKENFEESVDKTAKKLKDAEVEAKRRKFVVEQKEAGATIELLDMLRKQVKNKEGTNLALNDINSKLDEVLRLLKK